MGFDRIAEALSHRTRRHVLAALLDHNLQSAHIRTREAHGVQLQHNHLPKLAAMDYIEWDRDDGSIVKGPAWHEIEPVLRMLDDNAERVPDDTF